MPRRPDQDRRDNDACVARATCADGQTLVAATNSCAELTCYACPAEYIDSNTLCVANCAGNSSNALTYYLRCAADQIKIAANDGCVARMNCGDGQTFVEATNSCAALTCPGKFINSSGTACTRELPMDEYIDSSNTTCVASCGEGEYINSANTLCVASCGGRIYQQRQYRLRCELRGRIYQQRQYHLRYASCGNGEFINSCQYCLLCVLSDGRIR